MKQVFVKSQINDLPQWAKGVIGVALLAGVGIVAYTFYKKLSNMSDTKNDRQQLNAENNELNKMKISPTISKSQAEGMANAIFTALDGYASDENVVYSQLAKVKNNADWLMLSIAYGTREISSGKYNPAPNYKGTLIGALNDELDSSERAKANAILNKNGVTYTI
jgi:hypothetical protein